MAAKKQVAKTKLLPAFRVTPAEHAKFVAAANRAGRTIGGHMRMLLFPPK